MSTIRSGCSLPPPNPGDQLYDPGWRLFNFGNPDALKWMTDHVDQIHQLSRELICIARISTWTR